LTINYSGLGVIHFKKGEYSHALEYYQQAALLADSIGALQQESEAHKGLAECYEELASTQGQPPSFGGRSPLRRAKPSGSPLLGGESRRAPARGWSASGGKSPLNANAQKYYKLSLEHYKQYSILKDSVFNEEKSKDLGKLEAKHEFEMAEQERKRQEEEQQRILTEQTERRNLLQYSGILLFILLLFFAVFLLSTRFKSPLTGGRLPLAIRGVSPRQAEGLIFITFLLVFEFLLVLTDPYLEQYTGGEPAYKLIINAGLAGLIFPLHSIAESKLKQRLFSAKRISIKLK